MSDILLVIFSIVLVVLLLGGLFLLYRRPRRLKTSKFQDRWQALQKLCKSKQDWAQAIIDADKLLDEVLKKRRFSGKTTGERLTKAQRLLTNNEAVWFGHKLRSKIEADPSFTLKEADVKQALVGIRQALKDLGALADGK